MKQVSYKDYKESGVKWLGAVPSHWTVIKLKRIVSTPVTDGPHETPDKLDEGIPFISAEAIKNETIDFEKKWGFISLEDHKRFSNKYRPKRDDIYVIKSGATTGNVAIVETDVDFNIWSPLAAIRTNQRLAFPRYIFNFLKSREYRTSVQLGWSFGTQQNIGMNVLENLSLPLPPLPEQRAIAAFLDRETERIDSLIEKKKKQIDLLQRKRAALISQAVTKGLDPNVKMKDSGVEWLGEVPENWVVYRIKYCGKIKYGLGEPPAQKDGGLPFVRATDIDAGKISLDSINRVDPDDVPWSRDPTLKANDILVVRSGAYTGDSAIVPIELEGSIAGYDMVLRVSNAYPAFVAYTLLSKYILDGQIMLERMRAAQPHLNAEELGTMILLLPPVEEQVKIAEYLDKECRKNQRILEKIRESIKCSEQYRTSLISTAVTGKIDVRKEAVA